MSKDIKPIYNRVLIKLSGEFLSGKDNLGININTINRIVKEIKNILKLKVQVALVVGGGNFCRGKKLYNNGINRIISDHMGMLATVINGLAIYDTLNKSFINSCLMSAIPLKGICENFNFSKAIDLLQKQYVVIFSAGIGNPLFTTDFAACLRSIEIEAEIILKATNVNGVFSCDPRKYPEAIFYKKLKYKDVIKKELKIMDLSSFIFARDYNIPIRIFNINKIGALYNAVINDKEGTLITN